ncbi:MAG: MG2 domain-containing protein, partial [Bacteroidota bacterium]
MNELKRRLAQLPRIYWLAGTAASVILIATVVIARQKAQWEHIPYNPAFDPYLSAFTEGEISRTDGIILRFREDVLADDAFERAREELPIQFEPEIPGEVAWVDNRTIKYRPHGWLPSETRYTASVDMKAMVPSIPDSLRKFRFQFATKPQAVDVQLAEITSVDRKTLKKQRVSADLKLNDVEKLEVLEEAISAKQDGKQLPIKWHYNRAQTRQHFEIDDIQRSNTASELVVHYGGLGYGMREDENTLRIPIPPLDAFEIVDVYVTNAPAQSIVLEFSDPLNEAQNIDGLVKLGTHDFDWRISGHQIKLFPKQRITGNVKVEVLPGIENSAKYKLKDKLTRTVKFEALKPQVKIAGNGVIIPQGKTLPFVFEAVGLKAVDVRVTKIYESNVPQFLQVNQLWENSEIHRVGRVQTIERVDLNKNTALDLNDWNKHVLDLSKLIQNEPGAIYEVSIGFRQSYALCDCPNQAVSEATGEPEDADKRAMIQQGQGWDGDDYFSYGGYYSYNYYERNDPCKSSYYTRDKVVSRNVLASSIGLIAKQGVDGRLFVATTHIETTDPLSGVQLEVLDYQQKTLATATSDDDGQLFIPIKSEHKPFLLVAKYGNQRGYLRLDDGSALALNKFDIKGAMYRNGMRAFIYGERGVWRPGDPMHLTAMLKTIDDTPDDLPLTAELYNPQGQLVKKQRLTESTNGFYAFTMQTSTEA